MPHLLALGDSINSRDVNATGTQAAEKSPSCCILGRHVISALQIKSAIFDHQWNCCFGVSHSTQPPTVSTYPHPPIPMHIGMTLVGLKQDHQQCTHCYIKCYTLIHIGITIVMDSCCLPSLCVFTLISCLYIWSVPNDAR